MAVTSTVPNTRGKSGPPSCPPECTGKAQLLPFKILVGGFFIEDLYYVAVSSA